MGHITTIDPSTGTALDDYPLMNDTVVDGVLAAAAAAGASWRRVGVEDRASVLRSVARLIERHRTELAELATAEMGKPIVESRAEVDKCALGLDYVADHAVAFLADQHVGGGGPSSQVRFDPLGVVLAIMPWNYPYWQVVRATASTLVAGNVVVLKHAENVTGCALLLTRLCREAGLPDGVLAPLVVPVDRVERLIADPRVAAVTLTGSTRAGRSVAAAAGRALKPSVLELGGSDPFVVLDDADIEAAAAFAVKSRYQNSGQACIAAKRLIVDRSAYDAFKEALLEKVDALAVGDPLDESTAVGPLARADLRDTVARQVTTSIDDGSRLLIGGHVEERPGFFYAPTVVEDVPAAAPMATEEVFGPAVALFRVDGDDQAVELANATPFGLGSNVWTRDVERGRELAGRLQAGHTAVNGMTASDPRLPFGGVKASGYGRELGRHGFEAFVNAHVVTTG